MRNLLYGIFKKRVGIMKKLNELTLKSTTKQW